MQNLYRLFSKTGCDKLVWKMASGRLRILCYHGVCEDRLAREPWMPAYFVGRSAFESQLQYLGRHASVLPLREAVTRLRNGSLPPRAVSVTFDDGYANNLYVAYPLLKRYGVHATFFLSTAGIESGEMFPFLKLKLIREHAAVPAGAVPEYKSAPLDQVLQWADDWWGEVKARLSVEQVETLRPLGKDEVAAFDPAMVELGAHSDSHCILRNETRERRDREIRISVAKVSAWTGRPARLFSYPNGERGDFDEADKETARAAGIVAAVTGIGGANAGDADPLALRRYPVTLHHDESAFRAEATGFRNAVRSAAGVGL